MISFFRLVFLSLMYNLTTTNLSDISSTLFQLQYHNYISISQQSLLNRFANISRTTSSYNMHTNAIIFLAAIGCLALIATVIGLCKWLTRRSRPVNPTSTESTETTEIRRNAEEAKLSSWSCETLTMTKIGQRAPEDVERQ